ncbi:MAG: 3-methyl-2-oxobutanoate hydroxymethyltransferase [Campylobacterales bacterium]|nr:3-methyl-2-oxobutanoate hydroxymethyltransferase [Campylobacterales bacterium]
MKLTVSSVQKLKNVRKISMITAYDALFAKLFDDQVDFILVGDSLNMSFGGQKDTLSITLEQMIYHTQAVCNGAKNTFVICDMPFGTYTTKKSALENAIQVFRQSNADAIKIEGGKEKASIVRYLTSHSIAVVGHIGLLPQNVRADGGYKIQGKDEQSIASLVEDAKAIEQAGAFMIVLEGVKYDAAVAVTKAVGIPVIGIGAGNQTDGQVLVWSDMLGLNTDHKPKFVREYLNAKELVTQAVKGYKQDVELGSFPSIDESY